MVTKMFGLALAALFSITVFAGQGAGRAQRPPLTPAQEVEQKRRAADTAIADGIRPIDMLDSVWIEELSWMEVRDQIAAGKTTALLGSGGVEKNGPYTATGKHNYVLKTTLDATARKHSKALVAPLVTWEPCNPDRENLTPGSFCVTPETYKALLRDAVTSLKSMGFKDIFMVADSGGNTQGMTEIAKASGLAREALYKALRAGAHPRFEHGLRSLRR